jgi:hypothetical protein
MRRVITACAVALCFAAASVSAQDEATIKSKTKIKADDGKVVTATGCLTGGPASFTLAHSNTVAIEKRTTVGTSGTTIDYMVVPRNGVDLATHIGQMVEVTGVLVPATSKDDKSTKIKVKTDTKADIEDHPDAKGKSETKLEVPRTAMPQLAVTSVKMVGQTCIASER